MSTPLHAKSLTLDGWTNLLLGLGDPKRDARMSTFFREDKLTDEGCRKLYGGNFLAAKIIDRPAADMIRAGFDLKAEKQKDKAEKVTAEWVRLDVLAKFRQAMQWRRAYGGSMILIGANDKQADLSKPLNEEGIQAVDYLNVFDCTEAFVTDWYDNPLGEKFGEPRIYRLNPRAMGTGGISVMTDVHESRVLRFCGPVVARNDLLHNQGWGDSVLQRAHTVLRDEGVTWDAAAALVNDFSVAVYKIRGLQEAMASDNEGLVLKRLNLLEMCKSFLRGVLIDADGEDYERKPTPLSGLPDVLDRFCMRVSAAGDMPVALVFGRSPGGLNGDSNGEADVRFYYDGIDDRRQNEVVPQLTRLTRVIMLAKGGPTSGRELKNWTLVPRPLWQPDSLTVAQTRAANATADCAYVQAGILLPEEVAESRFGGDTYGEEIELFDDRDALIEEQEQAAAEQQLAEMEAKAAQEGPQQPGQDAEGPAPKEKDAGPKKRKPKPSQG